MTTMDVIFWWGVPLQIHVGRLAVILVSQKSFLEPYEHAAKKYTNIGISDIDDMQK